MAATQIFNKVAQSRRSRAEGSKTNGFMLPSVVILSTAMLIIAAVLAQLVVNNYTALTRSIYAQIAQTAAKSGVDYAKEQFVATGAYDGTSETTVVQNSKYRVTFEVSVLETSSDGLKKEVESIGRLYLPEISTTQFAVRSVRSDIIRTTATLLTPDQLSPMAWYDASSNNTLHGAGSATNNWTYLNNSSQDYLNERTSNGTQTSGSWNANWMGLGYSSQLGGVYAGTLFDLSGIPDGATINSAYIQMVSQGTTIGLSWVQIEALVDGQAPVSNDFSPPSASNQLRNKTRVGPTINWIALDWPIGNQAKQTPDIKDIVQAVIDQPGFDQQNEFAAFRFSRVFGLGTHRINKGQSSIVVNYTVSGSTAVQNGDSVVTWDDKSGNGHHLVAPSGREPTYVTNQQNGLAMIDFPYSGSTSGKYMQSDSFDLGSTATAGTMFIVAKGDNTSGDNASLARLQGTIPTEANCAGGQSCTTRTYELARNGSSLNTGFYIDRSGTGGTSTLSALSDGTFNSATSMLTGGVAYAVGGCNPNIDQASVDIAYNRLTTVNCPSGGIYPKSFKDGLTITVADGRGDRNFDGQIGELIIYDKQLSCQQVQSIQKYLRQKWFGDTSDTNIIACSAPPAPGF